jgi:3-hydroxyisobutyrate dehydrogenase-like beta-hydroxyacid dehydrogenase
LTLVKLVGNFLISSAGYSVREALTLAERNGVSAQAVIDMLTQTLFPSPIYQNYGRRIAEGNAPFGQSPIPLKDVGLFRSTAQDLAVSPPMADRLYDLLRSNSR